MSSVVFWDIDGTLLTTGRAGIFAWEEALREVCAVDADLSSIRTSGMTDAQIAALLLELHGREAADGAVTELLRAYERNLPVSLHRRRGRVLPRVVEILEDLDGRDDVACVLLTGNTPAGARAKLEHYGLTRFFSGEGAFCLGPGDRAEIARRAYSLAEALAGEPLSGERLYVVGDTPHDVRCGQAIGARTVAVASGSYGIEDLAATDPWLLLEELPGPDRFRELLGIVDPDEARIRGRMETGTEHSLEALVDAFEQAVLDQEPVAAEHYDEEYYVSGWREGDNRYDLETRRRIEARNPALIKEVFEPEKVLDLGCGPGFLMYFLHELGVHADGVDHSPSSKELAPEAVRERILVAPVTAPPVEAGAYDLVICREVLEHLTVLQIRQAVAEMCRASSRFVYVTTRFHPDPSGLLDLTTQFEVDSTHITLLAKPFLRCLFVLEGFRSRPDLEGRMDWQNKGRVLVYERGMCP